MFQIEDIIGLIFITCWTQATAIIGGSLTWAAYRHNWRSFYLFLTGALLPGGISLFVMREVMFGSGPKDAQDGVVVLFISIYMWIFFVLILGIGSIFFIFSTGKASESRKPHLIYLTTLPALLLIGTIVSVFPVIRGNALGRQARTGDESNIRYIYEHAPSDDPFGAYLDLAQNPNVPPDILDALGSYEHPAIRVRIASHPKSSDALIERLTHDENQCVASFAASEMNRRKGAAEVLQNKCH